MAINKNVDGFAERECCICGRVFLPAVEHMYHANGRWCCTWPCYVELKTQIEAQKAAERARKIAARKAKERERAKRREEQAPPLPVDAKDEKIIDVCENGGGEN